MNTVLYMHGGSGNHGCEALVRTTTKIIKDSTGLPVVLWSTGKQEDIRYGIDKIVDKLLASEEMSHKSIPFVISYVKEIFLKKDKAMFEYFIRKIFKDSIAFSIGGDNYCYHWSAQQGVDLDKKIREVCKKNIFWGCSIEESNLTEKVKKDLKGFDLITARESISYETIKKINPNTILVTDPAFLLESSYLPLPNGFIENNTVGINISPLINDYESGDNIAFENYVSLIKYIINETDMNVCLIPHVVWSYNNDFTPINELYDIFKHTGRIIKLNDHNCEELKGFISRCRFFVGARTHATIAAYSTCVPTLVVGYSVKSRGIAKDLFGAYENYVLPVQNLNDKHQLCVSFRFIMENEDKIKQHLRKIMPQYKENAKKAGEALKEIFLEEK